MGSGESAPGRETGLWLREVISEEDEDKDEVGEDGGEEGTGEWGVGFWGRVTGGSDRKGMMGSWKTRLGYRYGLVRISMNSISVILVRDPAYVAWAVKYRMTWLRGISARHGIAEKPGFVPDPEHRSGYRRRGYPSCRRAAVQDLMTLIATFPDPYAHSHP
jgi:hypothetical protein